MDEKAAITITPIGVMPGVDIINGTPIVDIKSIGDRKNTAGA